MSYKNFKTCPIALTTLTPIHVGCGDVYEPTNFVADEQKRILYGFDPFLVKLPDDLEKGLYQAVQSGGFKDIYQFYLKNIDIYKAAAKTVVPFDSSISKNLSALTVDSMEDQSEHQIQRQCYCQSGKTQVPYIPGSEIKGAIHTALLDHLSYDHQPELDVNVKNSSVIERYFFGNKITNFPMKLLSISDLHAPVEYPAKQKIIIAVRVKKPFEKMGDEIRAAFEVIQKGQFRCFTGTMTVKKRDPRDDGVKYNYQTHREVFKDLNRYSTKEFESEYEGWLQAGGRGNFWLRNLKNLLNELEPQLKEGSVALIRIGKNTGARNLTLRTPDFPKIKIHTTIQTAAGPVSKTYEASDATTMFAALDQGSYLPFGWALLELVDESNGKCIKLWSEGASFSASDIRQKEQEELEEQERKKKLKDIPEERQKVDKLFSQMPSNRPVRPGTDIHREFKKLLEESRSWSVENKRYFGEKFFPILKEKGLDVGNEGKSFRRDLKKYKEAQ